MKKTISTLLMVFGVVVAAYPQTLTCSCGSQASGRTIEYQIVNPGGGGAIDCCRGRAVGTNNAYSFTWAAAGHNNYVLTSSSVYPTSAAAQSDCCKPEA